MSEVRLPQIILRELPGMAELMAVYDAMLADKNNEWSGSKALFERHIDQASRRWFGLTKADTEFNEERDLRPGETRNVARRRWENLFEFPPVFGMEGDALRVRVWSGLGWDVTDDDGDLLLLAHYFERQMICAANRILGRLPGEEHTDSELTQAAEDWGKKLQPKARARLEQTAYPPPRPNLRPDRGDRPPRQ